MDDFTKIALAILAVLVIMYMFGGNTQAAEMEGMHNIKEAMENGVEEPPHFGGAEEEGYPAENGNGMTHADMEVAVEDRPGPIGSYPISPVGSEYNEKIIAGDPRTSYCFPKDALQSDALLPTDSASTWAQFNPHGEGYLKNRNFLTAGYHIGIDTISNSLRNANLQLRSEPPNPQIVSSPWLQSSIGPDLSRLPLEIGESCY